MNKLLIALIFALPVLAQQKQPVYSLQEDCGAVFSFTAASSGAQAAGTVTAGSTGTTNVIDNNQASCLDWVIQYTPSSGISALSLLFQAAPNVAGVPGTWTNYPGTLTTGINPNTAATTGGAVTEATGPQYPFLRLNLTSLTGSGTVTGKLLGWKRRPPSSGGSGGSGCPGTVGTPCVVIGPTAPGAAPTFAPVMISGIDGTNVRVMLTDTIGRVVINGQTANGGASAGNPVIVAGVDTVGNVRRLQTDPNGVLALVNTLAGADGAGNGAGGNFLSNTGGDRFLQNYNYYFNGSSWDRVRGNTSGAFVVNAGNGTVLAAQQSVTASAVALGTNTSKNVCVKALIGNGINVYVGPSGITTSTGYELAPGDGVCLPVSNSNLLFVIASTTGASVSWVGTN